MSTAPFRVRREYAKNLTSSNCRPVTLASNAARCTSFKVIDATGVTWLAALASRSAFLACHCSRFVALFDFGAVEAESAMIQRDFELMSVVREAQERDGECKVRAAIL